MNKIGLFLLLLTLPFSIFAQSPPSDSLIQKYRKEVRKFMRQAGFDGKKTKIRKVNTEIYCDSLPHRFYEFLFEIDSTTYCRDTSFMVTPCRAFPNKTWDSSFVKWAEFINVKQIGASPIQWRIQFGRGQRLWSYCAPLFSPDGKWCIICYFSLNDLSYGDGATLIYKKTWRGWRKYKVLTSWSSQIHL